MKVISVDDAKHRLPAIFEEALSGEIIRFRSASGAELELTPVQHLPERVEISPKELAESYNDSDWAKFENNCAKASDE
jgi:hypothetical protein